MGTKTQKQSKCCYHNLNAKQLSLGRINTKETWFFTESAGCGASSRQKTRFGAPMRPGLILRKFCIES